MKKIIIAIDGYSSTGKSTIAKSVAKQLNYIYIDTGAMYRAVTYYALKHGLITKKSFESKTLIEQLPNLTIGFKFNPQLQFAEVYLNEINVESEIRTLKVSQFVSQVAAVSEVRKKLVEQQQSMGKDKGLVMDGRDIGTVVFPKAELKIFMTASPEIRAKRRYKELLERGHNLSFDEVLNNLISRDHIDSTREDSPLVKAEDAIEIDNSNLSIEGQVHKILQLAKSLINQKSDL